MCYYYQWTGVCVGSAAQLATFSRSKQLVAEQEIVPTGGWLESLVAGFVSGIAVTAAMTPFDVISLRLYNQQVDPVTGRGALYRGFFDCVTKMARTEGPLGFYKGWGACYFRIGPHSTLSMVSDARNGLL